MPEITKEYLDSLSDTVICFIRDYIWERFGKSQTESVSQTTDKTEVRAAAVPAAHQNVCPKCGGTNIVRNGTRHGLQRYLCRSCGRSFCDHTGTFMAYSKLSESQMKILIDSEVRGDTLAEMSHVTGLSRTSCFNNRQKLYKMAGIKADEKKLSGQIEMDSTYSKINLSGTRPENMPRYSKRRGSGLPIVGKKHELSGPSHHKICIATAIDEHDNPVYKVVGLGQESLGKYEKISSQFVGGKMIISDKNQAIQNFAKAHGMKSDVIPVKPNQKHFTTPLGNSLGDVNELHTELKTMVSRRHGVSVRHLQGYLDWISYMKGVKYSVERDDQAEFIYKDLHNLAGRLDTRTISRTELPIDLKYAYGEYHYGIFAVKDGTL